jgi:hypothetical protein
MGYQFVLVVILSFPGMPYGNRESTTVIQISSQSNCDKLKREVIEDSRRNHQEIRSISCYRKIN